MRIRVSYRFDFGSIKVYACVSSQRIDQQSTVLMACISVIARRLLKANFTLLSSMIYLRSAILHRYFQTLTPGVLVLEEERPVASTVTRLLNIIFAYVMLYVDNYFVGMRVLLMLKALTGLKISVSRSRSAPIICPNKTRLLISFLCHTGI